jgi:aspartyl-tRNA(Asn)/glutamyl-tRNA(Gln) amidotransferase subunit A
MPCGFTAGLPSGLQLVGRANDEAMLCRIGDAFERSTDFSAMKPAWR